MFWPKSDKQNSNNGGSSKGREPVFSPLVGSILFHFIVLTAVFWLIQSHSQVGNRMGS